MSAIPENMLPPQSKEAEQTVLGCMIRFAPAIGDAIQIVRETDFYKDANRVVFRHIISLWDKGERVDLTSLAESLNRASEIQVIGGYGYLGELFEAAPTGAAVEFYAKIVRDRSILRQLHYAAMEMVQDVSRPVGSADETLATAEKKIFAIAQGGVIGSAVHVSEIVPAAYDQMDAAIKGKDTTSSISTGLTDVDSKTAGMQNSELIIVAARPSVGKTSIALGMVAHLSVHHNLPSLFVSLEQSRVELANRFLSSLSGVSYSKMKHGSTSQEDRDQVVQAGNLLSRAPIYVDDTPGQGMLRIAANARRLKLRHGLRLVVIDYLQLIEPDDVKVNRQEQVAFISRRLKHLARELAIPVVCLAQLNREVESRNGGEPRLADLRDSGEIEQNADVVMLLHPDAQNPSVVGLNVAKQRNGPTGKVSLFFRKEVFRFENYVEDFSAFASRERGSAKRAAASAERNGHP